jgi:hypothetical protein
MLNIGGRWGWLLNAHQPPTPDASFPENGPDTRFSGVWMGPRADVEGCGEEKNLFSQDTAVTVTTTLFLILVLDLSFI